MTDLLSALTDCSERNIRSCAQALREGGLLTVQGRGFAAPDWTTTDAVNVLIASLIAENSSNSVSTVTATRAAVRTFDSRQKYTAPDFLDGLTLGDAKTAGAAIDALVEDHRSGRFAAWLGTDDYTSQIAFVDGGQKVGIALQRFGATADVRLEFTRRKAKLNPRIETIVNISDPVLLRIAQVLGPIE